METCRTEIITGMELRCFKNVVNESIGQGSLELFVHGDLSDVTVKIGNKEYLCHRFVLASVSEFFRALFRNEVSSDHVTLDSEHVSQRSFALLLDMLYKKLDGIADTDIATDMLISAVFLQIQFLQRHCEEYLVRTMKPATCPDLWQFAELYTLEILERGAKKMATARFLEVSQSEAFDQLPLRFLLFLLSSEDLVVSKEDHVADRIIKWVTADKEEREKYVPVLLPLVTFVNLSDSSIQSLRRPCTYINHIHGYLEEALTYKLEGATKLNSVLRREILARQQWRVSSAEVDAAFTAFGHLGEAKKEKCLKLACETLGYLQQEARSMQAVQCVRDENYIRRPNYEESSEEDLSDEEEDVIQQSKSDSNESHLSVFDDVPEVGFATCVWRNEVYISGGCDAPLSFKVYNSGTANWSKLPNLKQGRCGHAMVAVSKNIFLLGGVPKTLPVYPSMDEKSAQEMHDEEEEKKCLREISVYSTETQIWETFARLPNPVTDVTAAVLGHRIYVIGGSDAAAQPMPFVQCVDTLTATVYRAGSLPSPTFGARALSDGVVIYVVVPEGDVYQMQENSFLADQRGKQLLLSRQNGEGAILMTGETEHSTLQLTAITEDSQKRMAATRHCISLRNNRKTNSCSDQTRLQKSSEEGDPSLTEQDGEKNKEEAGDNRHDSSDENTAALLSVYPLTPKEDTQSTVSLKKLTVIPGRRHFGACLHKGELWVAGGQDAEEANVSDVIGVNLHTRTVTTKSHTLNMSRCDLHVINVPKLSDKVEYRFTFRRDDLVKNGDTVKSQLVKINKFDWYLSVKTVNENLGVYLYKTQDFASSRWAVSAMWEIEILSTKIPSKQQHTGGQFGTSVAQPVLRRDFSFTFKDWEEKGHGDEKFISMDDLTDPANGYIDRNGEVTVKAKVTITGQPWQEPLPAPTPTMGSTAGFALGASRPAAFTFAPSSTPIVFGTKQ